jgi:hypothetical protein
LDDEDRLDQQQYASRLQQLGEQSACAVLDVSATYRVIAKEDNIMLEHSRPDKRSHNPNSNLGEDSGTDVEVGI